MQIFREIFGPRSGQVTSSGQLTLLKKSQLRHGYSSRMISMKLTGLLSVISTYKVYLIFYPCELRSGQFRDLLILGLGEICNCFQFRINYPKLPNSFRIMAIHPICNDPSATDDEGSRGGRLRTNEVKISFRQKHATERR